MPERPTLDAIKARLAAATPRPWVASLAGDRVHLKRRSSKGAEVFGTIWRDGAVANADLIAHAPTDLAALIAEVEQLREGECSVATDTWTVTIPTGCDFVEAFDIFHRRFAEELVAERERRTALAAFHPFANWPRSLPRSTASPRSTGRFSRRDQDNGR